MILHLGNLLGDSIRRANILPEMQAVMVMNHFKEVAASFWGSAGQNIQPLYLKNARLTLKVPSSVYAQEVKLREREILERLNASLSKNIVQGLRCLV